MSNDNRIVYGTFCTWWGSIDDVSLQEDLPVCPHCKGVLYEVDKEEWEKGIEDYEKDQLGYREIMNWTKDKCFKSMKDLYVSYKLNHVILDLNVLKWLDVEIGE